MASIFQWNSPNKQIYDSLESLSIQLLDNHEFTIDSFLALCLQIIKESKLTKDDATLLENEIILAGNHFYPEPTLLRTLGLVNRIRLAAIQILKLDSYLKKDSAFEKTKHQFKQACKNKEIALVRQLLIDHHINVNTLNFCKEIEQCLSAKQVGVIHLALRAGFKVPFYLKYLKNSSPYFGPIKELKPAELEIFINTGTLECDKNFINEILYRDDLLLLLFSYSLINFTDRHFNEFVSNHEADSTRKRVLSDLKKKILEASMEILNPLITTDLVNIVTSYLDLSPAGMGKYARNEQASTYCLSNFSYRINYSSSSSVIQAFKWLEQQAVGYRMQIEVSRDQFLNHLYVVYQEISKERERKREQYEAEERASENNKLLGSTISGI